MIPDDVEYLKCIRCAGPLAIKAFEKKGKECVFGKLSCKKCSETYPIINGIPRMLPSHLMKSVVLPAYPDYFKKYHFDFADAQANGKAERLKRKTADTFGFEWLKYPKILKHFEADWARYFNPFIKKEDIKGSVVADFGCGMAKHGYFIGKYGAKKYIGLDLSMAVEAAYRNTSKYEPLIVQADIYSPPLVGEKIDIFYSIGVLHHLPDPEGGFKSITKLMKKKGSKIFIWVYGKRKNTRALYVYNPIRFVTTRLPKGILYPLCHIPAAVLHSINLVQNGFEKIGLAKFSNSTPFAYYRDFPYEFKVSDSYDVFGTPKQVYYDMKDIDAWFKRAKLKPKLEHDIVQGIKGFAVKR